MAAMRATPTTQPMTIPAMSPPLSFLLELPVADSVVAVVDSRVAFTPGMPALSRAACRCTHRKPALNKATGVAGEAINPPPEQSDASLIPSLQSHCVDQMAHAAVLAKDFLPRDASGSRPLSEVPTRETRAWRSSDQHSAPPCHLSSPACHPATTATDSSHTKARTAACAEAGAWLGRKRRPHMTSPLLFRSDTTSLPPPR